MKKNLFLFCLASVILNVTVLAQEPLDKGWESFYKNDYKEARTYFTQATADADSKAEAFLALSIMASIDKSSKEAFKDFMNFYKASKDPYPYLFALWTSSCIYDGSFKTSDRMALYNQIIADPSANGTILAMAHSSLGDHYSVINDYKKAIKEYDKIGAITTWQLVGEFENISGSGFDKDYDPVKMMDPKHAFTNKYGAEVFWFDLPENRRDKWVDFSFHFNYGNSVIYAQTYVNSIDDREVQLRIGTSGSLKAWVNDKLVYTESEERNNDIDTYVTTIKLNEGNNRILIQIGESEVDRSNFLARITDEKGRPVIGLTYSTKQQTYKKETNFKPEVIANFAEEYFLKMIEKNPGKMINYLMLAETYLRNEKSYEARRVLLKAQKIAPKCSYLYYDLIGVYSKEENVTEATAALEWLKDNDPESLISLNLLYDDDINKEDYKTAETRVDKIEKLYGKNESTLLKRVTLAAKNDKQDNLIKLVEEGYKKYPDDKDFVDLKHIIETDVNKNYTNAIKVLKKYSKNHYSNSVLEDLVSDYFKSGNASEGLNTYKAIVANSPGSASTVNEMGDIYFQIQNYSEAEKWYKKALTLAPYYGPFWGDLASCYENQSKKDDAIECYEKSISFKPNQYENRVKLRKLLEEKEIYNYFVQPDVYALYKSSPKASDYPEDNSVVLLDETQKIVYKGGASEEKHIFLVKVFNAQGIDAWKSYYIPYSSMQRLVIEKTEVIKVNGSKVAAESQENHVVFTSLEVGDAIHITYKIENYRVGKLAPHFWDKCYFSHAYPFLKTKYSLLINPDIKFNTKFTQEEIQPKVTKEKEFNLYIWEKTDQASIKNEDRMPKFADYSNVLFLSSFPDWTFISNWYYDLASTKAKSDFEVKETVAALFEGKQNLSTMEKVKEVYNYIVKNIRYSSVSFRQGGLIPQKASKVLNTKLGDCKDVSTLFVAMCKEIGVNASWVLVNTRNNGRNDIILPSIEFNHCIAKLNIDNKDYYIELTSDYLPFNSFYNYLINAYALDVKSDKTKDIVTPLYLNPTTRKTNEVIRTATVTVDDLDLTINKTNYKTGRYAASMRETYRDLGKKEQEKNMLEAITGEYPNIKLNSLEFKGLSDRIDTVKYSFNYTASNAVTSVSGLNLFMLPWADKAEPQDFVFNQERKYPIDLSEFGSWDKNIETLTITIPKGRTLAEIPKTVKLTCAIADYSLTFSVYKNVITAKREMKFKKEFVQLAEIKAFADFYKKVITADNKQIAFR